MPFALHLPWLLLGLAAVAVPVLIHLLNRRRFEVVEWGAMRFLEESQKTRRKVYIEDFLLLLLRMLLVALLVLAMAGPFLTRMVSVPGSRATRDLVLVIDGSASMGCLTADGSATAREAAATWVNDLLGELQPGDAVGLIDARDQPVVLLALTIDHERVRQELNSLPPAEGGCDAPAALLAARQLLQESNRGSRDIVILTDGQRSGYSDATTLLHWEVLASQERLSRKRDDYRSPPSVKVVQLDPKRTLDPPNWSLGPLRTTRGVVPAGREVLFRGEVEVRGKTGDGPPHRVTLFVDGKLVRDLKLPGPFKAEVGKVPFSFTHRFPRPGSYRVTVVLEPDPPKGDRPEAYHPRDYVPGDNQQDYALEVLPFLPVLLVDGGNDPAASDRGVAYLRSALAPSGDPMPAVRLRTLGIDQFDGASLFTPGDSPRPRVVVLQDVVSLSVAQNEAVERFLNEGGGVLIALGSNADVGSLNEKLYRQGRGWLPAKIDRAEGDENKPDQAARVIPGTSAHPVLELFREVTGPGSIEAARFPRYWQTTVTGNDAAGTIMAMMRTATGEAPFLVERSYGAGRVVLCTVPLDASWGSTLPRLPAMVPLVNELVSYLAGVRTQGFNLAPGQPIHFRSDREEPVEAFTLQRPGSDQIYPLHAMPAPTGSLPAQTTQIPPQGMVLTCEQTRRAGVYRLGVPQRVAVLCPESQTEAWTKAGAIAAGDDTLIAKITENHWLDFDVLLCTHDLAAKRTRVEKILRPLGLLPEEANGTLLPAEVPPLAAMQEHRRGAVYYVVGQDRAETDLTPMSEDDRAALTRLTSAEFLEDLTAWTVERRSVQERPELWWLLLLGLVALLCSEVWLTSRIARART